MIKTVWVKAYNQKKGVWEEYEEPTGEVKKGIFGEKALTITKRRWIEFDVDTDHIIDGERLSLDTEKTLNQLANDGFEILSITPVISGRYSWTDYGTGHVETPTCASWGYSLTEGVMITARKA